METSGFFDAEELTDGTYDREYVAEQFANYFKLFIGNGVFASPTNQLKVLADDGMTVSVKAGWAFINGYWYHNDSDLLITVPANATTKVMTYLVVAQFDSGSRAITVKLVRESEVNRTAPYYELGLATIKVPVAATKLTDAEITDTRANENVCGFVTGLLRDVIPTNDLFQQFTAMFNSWFDHMKDQLTEDAAGKLQTEVDYVTSKLQNLQVGGRNLIEDSKGEFSGKYPNSGYTSLGARFANLPAYATHFVLSFEAKSTVAGDKISSYFYSPSDIIKTEGSNGFISYADDGRIEYTLTTNWTRYWVKWTAPVAERRTVLPCRLTAGNGTGTVSIRNIKFETGNVPTDWTPALEDITDTPITNSDIDTILNS